MQNFSYPYFSRDIAEFWRRWHISLSTWFRDYVYIPLGGSKGGKAQRIRNVFVIFLLSGFWHGAKWTFILWGFVHSLYFLPLLISKNNRKNLDIVAANKSLPNFSETIKILFTFSMVTLGWIFFRSEDLSQAWSIFYKIFTPPYLSLPAFKKYYLFSLIILFIVLEWFGRKNKYAISKLVSGWKLPFKYLFYYAIVIIIIIFLNGESEEFIYFQF